MFEAETHVEMAEDTITGLLMAYIKLSREKITFKMYVDRGKLC